MISTLQKNILKYHFRTTLYLKVVLSVLMSFFAITELNAQDTIPVPSPVVLTDTLKPELHSAHKATLYSLMLPGLGQAYNKKYWKIPVIYVGFGALAWNFKVNHVEMKKFTEAYRYIANKDSFPTDNEYVTKYDADALLQGREFYRRRVELTVIFSAVWYILNVVDAAVDAHFFDYDISDDLSLRLDPVFLMPTGRNDRYVSGLRLTLNL